MVTVKIKHLFFRKLTKMLMEKIQLHIFKKIMYLFSDCNTTCFRMNIDFYSEYIFSNNCIPVRVYQNMSAYCLQAIRSNTYIKIMSISYLFLFPRQSTLSPHCKNLEEFTVFECSYALVNIHLDQTSRFEMLDLFYFFSINPNFAQPYILYLSRIRKH